MVDFQGQKMIFTVCAVLLTLSVPVAIAYGFIADNYLKGMMIVIYVSAVLFVAFVPSWPCLNRGHEEWQPDDAIKKEEAKEREKEKEKASHQSKLARKKKN